MYVKQTWTNGRSGGTPASADRLSHLETQYDEVAADIGDGDTPVGAALRAREFALNVVDFGAVGDDATDNLAAFAAAFAALPASGGTVVIPPGEFYLSGTLDINKSVVLLGSASSSDELAGTTLRFPASTKGLHVRLGDIRARCRLSNLTLKGGGGTTTGCHGVHVDRGMLSMDNCHVEYFPAHGLFIDSTPTLSPLSLPDFAYIAACKFYGNSGDGIRLEGIDSNACTIMHTDTSFNLGWGINNMGDHNVFINCHADQTYGGSPGAFRDAGNSNAYYFPYVESAGKFLIDTGSSNGYLQDSQFGAVTLDITPATPNWEIVRMGGNRDAVRIEKQDTSGQHVYELSQRLGAGRLEMYDNTRNNWIWSVLGDGSAWYFNTTVLPPSDLTYDLGSSGSERWRAGYFGTLHASVSVKTGVYATGSRPTAASAGIGAMIYDTTLSKPVWSNGSVWKDAAGTTV